MKLRIMKHNNLKVTCFLLFEKVAVVCGILPVFMLLFKIKGTFFILLVRPNVNIKFAT